MRFHCLSDLGDYSQSATEIGWGPSSCSGGNYKLRIIVESRGPQILVHLQIKVQILGVYVPKILIHWVWVMPRNLHL